MNVPVLSKIKAWKEKRLRKKIVLRLLSNPNYKPSDVTMNLAEHIIYYINNGVSYLVK